MKFTYIFLAFIGILMYNAMLIQRDQKMFDAYDQRVRITPHERYCQQKQSWHPDCNLE